MRVVFALIVGVVVGALVAFTLANTLHQRRAYPRATMIVTQHHYATLRRAVRDARCPAATTAAALDALAAIVREYDAAFADGVGRDAGFRQRAAAFAATIDAARAAPPADCRALDTVVRTIDDRCEACHADYR